MAHIKAFRAYRPTSEEAPVITALPYDVYNVHEARTAVQEAPRSFLAIDRPEAHFPEGTDIYAPEVYVKAGAILQEWFREGRYIQEETDCYYVWEMTMNGRVQTGLAACSATADYHSGVIRKHENTRPEKEEDRVHHIEGCGAQTGPVLLVYRRQKQLKALMDDAKTADPIYDFTDATGVYHRIWRISGKEAVSAVTEAAGRIKSLYIADGHHRAAAASAIAKERKRNDREPGPKEYEYFLTVMFAEDEMLILDYNRIIKDRNGMSDEEILRRLGDVFTVSEPQDAAYRPQEKREMGLCLGGKWYRVQAKEELYGNDPVSTLDVEYLQKQVLEPLWGITEPGADPRIEFIGGDRGLEELERRCAEDAVAAFALYPTSMEELMAVADAGMLMPPKSTWFEPKLRTGLFIHEIEGKNS